MCFMLYMLHSYSHRFCCETTLPAGRKDPELPLKALGVLPPRGTASKRIKVLHVMGAFLEKSLESHGFSHVFPLKFKGLLADSEKFPEFDVFVMFDKGLLQW